MKNTTTFRLKGKKKKGHWILPRGMAKAPDGFMKKISYRPGTTSIFDDDNKKSAAKPKAVVFSYNMKKHDPHVEIEVPKSDKLLFDYLTKHPKFNKEYFIYDENAEATKKSQQYDKVEKALGYVSDAGEYEVKAAALAVFGFDFFSKTVEVCKAKLKERAFNNPDEIINVYKAEDFQNRYMVALMYCNNIIENNDTHSAVLWSDTKNAIMTIAVGETGIDKITEFINRNTPESLVLLQEFQARVDKVEKAKKEAKFDSATASKEISAKDKRIAELEKMLAEKQAPAEDKNPPAEEVVDKYENVTLEEAVALYKEQKGQDVPTAKATNLPWIVKQLS